ncbi:MAG: hypothetical protein MUE94_13190 [Verrucomicrobia bacterium]|nr:hypothetical protein [Verrucomicrobiota bacterium]
MNAFTSLVSLHPAGEEQSTQPDALPLDTLPGKFTLTRTDAALTTYGELVAWSGFLKHLGIIERCADRCPVARTGPNAAPVREVLHSFALSALVEGKRFCHVGSHAKQPKTRRKRRSNPPPAEPQLRTGQK